MVINHCSLKIHKIKANRNKDFAPISTFVNEVNRFVTICKLTDCKLFIYVFDNKEVWINRVKKEAEKNNISYLFQQFSGPILGFFTLFCIYKHKYC
jgi:hypothetical protein